MDTRASSSGSDVTLSRAGWELAVASFVVLFQELALIRWIPSQIRVAAYFPNLILLAAFLGLGIGSLRARKRSLLWLWPLALGVVGLATLGLSRIAFTARGVSEHLWLLYSDLPESAPVVRGVELPIIVIFVLSVLPFVPLGQLVASRIQVFGDRSDALWGYALDLGGSLIGIVAFAVVGLTGVFPVVWFSVVLVAGLTLSVSRPRALPALALGGAVLLTGVVMAEDAMLYSPYYALDVVQSEDSEDQLILANGSLHQVAFSLEEEPGDGRQRTFTEEAARRNRETREGYRFPVEQLRFRPEKVLVLGAGTGNDVSMLLEEGIPEIHAVEIDPAILALGREYHPDDPYASPRVKIFNTDARSFLMETEEEYDLIVFGTLDSMTRLSALSNVRLDNFVYTLQSLAAARDRLTPRGGLVLYFMVGEDFIHEHLLSLMAVTFEHIPAVHAGPYNLFNNVYMGGAAFEYLATESDQAAAAVDELVESGRGVPSDDWPYLYLARPGVSGFYLLLMGVFASFAVLAVLGASPELRAGLKRDGGPDWEMFLFGAGFLLLETRFVTAMNLVWGATWITSAVVFGAIVGVILLGTVLMALKPLRWTPAIGGLLVSLAVVYFVPVQALLHPAGAVQLLLSILVVGTPVFFASVCFALRFRTREAVDQAFGWNLLGAVAGGLLEFLSMSVGLRTMLLLALGIYLMVALLARRGAAPGEGEAQAVPEAVAA